ncbi:MAG: VOC family protein [Chitinophagales bacterium]|nr:VOC family protein [Chitinophagales bacterium]
MNIPQGYQTVMPYLIIRNADQFFDWMQQVFGATEKMRVNNEDGSLMHGELQIDDNNTIMYGQASAEWGENTGGFFIYVADADATYQKALDKGASSLMEMSDRDYGRTGGVKDPFGNTWWITTHVN